MLRSYIHDRFNLYMSTERNEFTAIIYINFLVTHKRSRNEWPCNCVCLQFGMQVALAHACVRVHACVCV